MGVVGRIWRLGGGFKSLTALMRIDWLGWVCSHLRQERLVRIVFGALPHPFCARNGEDGLAKRHSGVLGLGDTSHKFNSWHSLG